MSVSKIKSQTVYPFLRWIERGSLLCFFLLLSQLAAAQQTFRMPPLLHPGDSVAIISPSGKATQAMVDTGCVALRKWGLVPVPLPNVLRSWHGFGGTPEERAADVLQALRDPSIKAIIATRGGDGAPHVLARIPVDTFACYPKWIIGFSDVTALLCAEARAGVMSVHASMCEALGYEGATDTVSRALHGVLMGPWPEYVVPKNPYNNPGIGRGTLVGGNMSVLCGLAGSPFDVFSLPDIILFIEDVGENMSHVDRMLHLLELRGVLGRLRGLIVGKFTKYKKPENGFEDMYHMIHTYMSRYPDVPVCYDFPTGHSHLNNFPMVVGSQAVLEVRRDSTRLTFH